jgi:hypothetical protein
MGEFPGPVLVVSVGWLLGVRSPSEHRGDPVAGPHGNFGCDVVVRRWLRGALVVVDGVVLAAAAAQLTSMFQATLVAAFRVGGGRLEASAAPLCVR